MSTTQHPLTEAGAVELWDGHVPLVLNFRVWTWGDRRGILTALRAAFDAGREHERTITPADPHHDPRPWQDCTREDIREGDRVEAQNGGRLHVGVAHSQDGVGDWRAEDRGLLTYGDRWPLRRIPAPTTEKGTPMTETTTPVTPAEPLARTLLAVPEGYGAPHHDGDRIKADDYVLQLDRDGTLRGGLARYQDPAGNWRTAYGARLTWAAARADRPDALTVWPAPTPPAVEVELPGEPRRLTDVALSGGEKIAEAAWTGAVLLYARHPLATNLMVAPADQIEQWTLDGTRARRDGERPNGEPRFVKAQGEA